MLPLTVNPPPDSSPSPTACETTPGGTPQPPAAPSGLTATAVSSTTIDLDWTDNASNEDGFLIQRKLGTGGTFGNLDTVGANQTSYSDDTCDPETTYCYQVRAYNTICNATAHRQAAAVEVAQKVDVMVVIGGAHSSNSRRLAEVCVAVNPRTHHVATADELDAVWFAGATKVGITAGASTPDVTIDAVINWLNQLE